MSKADEIMTKLQDLTHFIEDAQNKLRDGEVLNLSHLDAEVAQLCEETLTLPPQDALKIQPIMGTIISKLEELGVALKDFQTNLQNKGA